MHLFTLQDIENIPAELKEWLSSNATVQTIETEAVDDFHAFVTKVTPLYNALKTFAVTTGRADVQALLTDLEGGLATAITSYLASGGNIGAAIAATATTELQKITTDVTTDAKNGLYGGLAIVAANLPQIAAPETSASQEVAAAEAKVAEVINNTGSSS